MLKFIRTLHAIDLDSAIYYSAGTINTKKTLCSLRGWFMCATPLQIPCFRRISFFHAVWVRYEYSICFF
jgi:hypothetical protein